VTRKEFAWALLTAGAALSALAPVGAQAPAGTGLEQAMALAVRNYPSIAAADSRTQAAEADLDLARTDYLPKVDVMLQANRSTLNNITGLMLPQSVMPSISGPPFASTSQSAFNSAAGVLASWQPFDFGYRGAKVRAALGRVDAAGADEDAVKLDVEANAATAFLNLAAAQRLEQVATANLERLHNYRFAVDVLVQNKLRAGVEGQLAASAEAQAQAVLAQASRDVARSRATLSRLTGSEWPAQRVDLPKAAAAAAPAPAAPSIHPLARKQQAVAGAAESDAQATARSYAPTVAIIGGASTRGSGRLANGTFVGGSTGLTPDTGNWAVGVQLNFALGSLPAVRARAASQRATETLAQLAERQAQAAAALASARQVAAVAPVQLSAARLAYDQQHSRFRSGLVTSVEVSSAAASLAQAEAQDALAQIELLRALLESAAAGGSLAEFHQAVRQP
jgi:outer membrane protein